MVNLWQAGVGAAKVERQRSEKLRCAIVLNPTATCYTTQHLLRGAVRWGAEQLCGDTFLIGTCDDRHALRKVVQHHWMREQQGPHLYLQWVHENLKVRFVRCCAALGLRKLIGHRY